MEKEPAVETMVATEAQLNEAGFVTAAAGVRTKRELARKLRIAFEHFRVVEPAHIERFQEQLMKDTRVPRTAGGYIYQKLVFNTIELYPNVPPLDVLNKIADARKLGCFDRFEVATLQSVTVVPDPVVFGVIDGCPNKYFVAQWDNDVAIEDILKEGEG